MHQNHFNLVRMVAASLVLVSHSYALSTGDPSQEPLRTTLGVTWGSIAVDVFFVTSGYLVTMSLFRRGSLRVFAVSRALRIYPGLLVALLLTVAVTGTFFGSLAPSAFWSSYATWKYLVKNALLVLPQGLEWSLPGALLGLPSAKPNEGAALNGSLWTLPVEVMMYAFLALGYAVLRRVRRLGPLSLDFSQLARYTLLMVAGAALAYDVWTSVRGGHDSIRHMFAMFFVGAAIWSAGVELRGRGRPALALAAVVVACAFVDARLFIAVYTLTLPFIVLALAYARQDWLLRYNRFGDYSYGVYIYAFPVQQWSAHAWKGIGPLEMTVVALPVTLLLAAISWHLVEKRALALKPLGRKDVVGA